MQKIAEIFDNWNVLKKAINIREWSSYVQNGDIWFCSIGVNVGYEEDGKNNNFERPVLILKKLSKGYFWGIPLTSKTKSGYYFYPVTVKSKSTTILLMQLRMLDCHRLRRKIGSLPPSQLALIKQKITEIIWSK